MPETIVVKFKRLSEFAHIPTKAHEDDACWDLYAATEMTVFRGQPVLVPTDIAMSIPVGFEAQVRPRSGLALNHGLGVLNSPGTIDAPFRGNVGVVMFTIAHETYLVRSGDRIAQLAIRPVPQVIFEETDELDETLRGGGGFGSTGT